MILTLTLSREEFAAKRRGAQDEYAAALRPVVEQALETDDWGPLVVAAERLYDLAYTEETGDTEPTPPPKWWAQQIEDTLEKTKGEGKPTVDRISLWLAAAILNVAAIEATQNDPEELILEWVTMHDDHVRIEHARTDGQQRPRGEKFDVDGVPMEFPGDSRAPIELWINCRCTLRPVLALEELMAAADKVHSVNETGETMDDLTAAVAGDVRVPWHGVLAPEGIASGDGRKFKEGALRHRDLPLPLTWQKVSDDGHRGNVTVATIDQVEMVEGQMRASGWFLDTPEANEVMGLIADFGKFGVSVDADDATFEVDEDAEQVVFTDARVCSACIVAIPAFAEAWVALGTWEAAEGAAPDSQTEEDCERDENGECIEKPVEVDEELVAAVEAAGGLEEFVDVAPGKTEDGPGWLTHPVDTDRLRDYWVRGPGAAKIAWGTPGDFDRCRANVAEYVKPQHINGYCANRHYDALGRWPGRNAHAAETLELSGEKGEAMSLVAAGGHCAPSEWFQNPNLTEPTAMTVTKEGRVFGHIATWGTCHIGFQGQCVTPPHSITDYAYFKTGAVLLDDDTQMPVGNLTIGGGHAGPRLSAKAALAHYDSTSTVVADVNVGDDEHGIWFAGWVRPGTPDEMVTALRASALSGDWRKVAGNLELVAALAVNVPGFGIPRPKVAASSEGQLSLVASGVVAPKFDMEEARDSIDVDAIAAAIIARLDERQRNKEKMAALAARMNGAQ